MSWKQDSNDCLLVADHMLSELKSLLDVKKINESDLPFIKIKIKNILENCRSPLDYVSNYIFITYCKEEYKSRERKFNVYYPNRSNKKDFDKCIDSYYRSLPRKRKDVMQLLEDSQPFPNRNKWLADLNKLNNGNKHNKLSPQRKVRSTRVHYGNFNGNVIIGGYFANNGSDIGDGINSYTFGESPELDKYFVYDSTFNLYFDELNLPVIETLQNIVINTRNVIEDLEKVLAD